MVAVQNTFVAEKAKEYIETHLSEVIRIQDICASANISHTQFYESFSRDTGTGISAYIRKRRLERARELLQNTGISVSETADIVGFADYNYFSRVYKKEFGISPHKTRKEKIKPSRHESTCRVLLFGRNQKSTLKVCFFWSW